MRTNLKQPLLNVGVFLFTQPSLKEQIVVSKQIRPSEIKIRNIPFQFIYHNGKHFFGAKKMWIDNFNKVLCSDLEKTFLDCLFKNHYAGGIVEVARAIVSGSGLEPPTFGL